MDVILVLVVDDNPDDGLLIQRSLEKFSDSEPEVDLKISVRLSRKGVEEFLQREKKPDVVVCDYRLPDMEWPAILKMLDERKLRIPVIVISGVIGKKEGFYAIREGAADFVAKDEINYRLGHVVLREAITVGHLRDLLETNQKVQEVISKASGAEKEG